MTNEKENFCEQAVFETGIAALPVEEAYRGFAYPASLCLLPDGRLLAVFSAKKIGAPGEAMGIYSSDGGRSWPPPQILFGGAALSPSSIDTNESYADPNLIVVDEQRVIAFCVSLLYQKGSMDLRRTRFWRRVSEDGGRTFRAVEEMPRHRKYYVGMLNAGLRLRGGTLVRGYSWDLPAESGEAAHGEGGMDLRSGVLMSTDRGDTWTAGGDVIVNAPRAAGHLPYAVSGIVEPAIAELPDGTLFLLGRTGTDRLWQSFSHDAGLSWEPATPSPLVSHNCPAALLRLREDGAILVTYNAHPLHRCRLSAAISTDGCQTWNAPKVIAPIDHPEIPEASYPSICQLPDGMIVLMFGQIDRREPERGADNNLKFNNEVSPRSDPSRRFAIRYARFNRAFVES